MREAVREAMRGDASRRLGGERRATMMGAAGASGLRRWVARWVARWGGVVALTLVAALASCAGPLGGVSAKATPTPPGDPRAWRLVFDDEFNGSSLDSSKWGAANYPSHVNNEPQYYTPADVSVADGTLKLTTEKRSMGGRAYTSGKVTTDHTFSFTYGRVDMRLKVPNYRGMWPAAWLLGVGCNEPGTGPCAWPAPGSEENDVMEMFNTSDYNNTTLHYGDTAGDDIHNGAGDGCPDVGPTSFNFSTEFHTFSTVWRPGVIDWYVDSVFECEKRFPAGHFQTPMFIILNVALGCNGACVKVDDAALPAAMEVDFVRVYSASASGSGVTRGADTAGAPLTPTAWPPSATP